MTKTHDNQSPFRVTLNHFYLTVDAETYAAIESSEFLRREFAPFEQRTTVRTDQTYTGIYFYASNTYFEFFNATQSAEHKLGDSGLAFGVEQIDAVKFLEQRLGIAPARLVTRGYKDKQIPWFYMLSLGPFPENSAIKAWVMEYHAQFLAEWNPSDKKHQGIQRKQILSRYIAVLSNTPAQPIVTDLSGLTLAVDHASAATLRLVCEKFGYQSAVQGEEVVLTSPDFVLRLIPERSSDRGIKRVEFRINRTPAEQREIFFGPNTTLRFEDDELAVWTF